MQPDRLATIPLFSSLSKKQLQELGTLTDEIDVPAGKHLADQGSFAYEFFVIEEGSASVMREGERLATLGPGDFFGEIGLLESERRTATVVAETAMRVVVVAAREFRQMLRDIPELAQQIEAEAKARLGR